MVFMFPKIIKLLFVQSLKALIKADLIFKRQYQEVGDTWNWKEK